LKLSVMFGRRQKITNLLCNKCIWLASNLS
jgi:hypothetical protein